MPDQSPVSESLATGQRSLNDRDVTYPLWPPLTAGCPETSTEAVQYPLEVTYDYDSVPADLFDQPIGPGLARWQPLLPPLADACSLGAGGTPLSALPELAEWAGIDGELYVKDESQNPTWSQKDRLNRLTVSAALEADAAGVVASSSGNHGASAAAYAARAGLPAVVLTSPETPAAVQRFLAAYDAAVLQVEGWDARQRAVNTLAADHEFHAVSSRTTVHTGHPFGPEGYKTIAYETYSQLGDAVPGSVFVPTAHAELLYGVWKGFRELETLGIAAETPTMVACEPAARGPLDAARDAGDAFVEVDAAPTAAHSIKATRTSYRGYLTLEESDGTTSTPADDTIETAQERLAGAGLWQEFSGAASLAGVRAAIEDGADVDGPVVCLATSSGFKDGGTWRAPAADPSWESIRTALVEEYGLSLAE